MQVSDIRAKFLEFFEKKNHTIVRSASLVPGNDPTLMFTNSGMVQFKDVFLGTDKRAYKRATSVQACLRAGGKHNDLENVGYTARHHTFFEMLGNWSFGDYFKRDALKWSFELLTQVYKLPAEKLWATVYIDDDESFDIWTKEIGLPAERVVRIGDNKGGKYMSDNFWMMADTGPCGPCSEIFYDHGEHIWGGPPGSPDEDGDRYIEIWNNVFMQFDMQKDGSIKPLPAPCVDTGMGLERLAAILQNVHSNYEIDLFANLVKAAARETECADLKTPSLNVIADHIRACSFLIVDGVTPSNEGRGYVLRRIIRRAIRHGYKLGVRKPFFYNLVKDLVGEMGEAYPGLAVKENIVTQSLLAEEEQFFRTIVNGMELLELEFTPIKMAANQIAHEKTASQYSLIYPQNVEHKKALYVFLRLHYENASIEETLISNATEYNSFDNRRTNAEEFVALCSVDKSSVKSCYIEGSLPLLNDSTPVTPNKELLGGAAFKLQDTFGFPFDLTADVCREFGFSVDKVGYEIAMNAQKEASRAAGKFKSNAAINYDGAKTDFKGYSDLNTDNVTINALYLDGVEVSQLIQGQSGIVVLNQTPFYAESGGQVGDVGVLSSTTAKARVLDTTKVQLDVFGHHVTVEKGVLNIGERLDAQVDIVRRAAILRNHSATHLLHHALRSVLGEHVQQKGSLVDADKTRFDFAHNAAVTADEITQIEKLVNQEILNNTTTCAQNMAFDAAKETGAMMLFGEKYGDDVRVLNIGSSIELCGGTHVKATGDIGLFKIISESGVAAGVRRIEAVTGMNALSHTQKLSQQLAMAANALKTAPAELVERIVQSQNEMKTLEKELHAAQVKIAAAHGIDLVAQAIDINGVKVLAVTIDGADIDMLRNTMDGLKDKLVHAVIVLAGATDKITLLAGVTKELTGRVKAGDVVNFVAQQVGGKGGGRPDLAQAGGTDLGTLPSAMSSVQGFVLEKLK